METQHLKAINLPQVKKNQEINWHSSPDKFLQQLNPKTSIDVLNSQNSSLIRMVGEHGEAKVKALLMILIDDTLNFFSVGKSMSDTQVVTTINLILDDYAVYKPDFFKLCFKRAMKGHYGTTYDRIDGQIIFEWLRKFEADYCREIEQERINEKKRIERDVEPLSDDETRKLPDELKPVPMPDYIIELKNKIGKIDEKIDKILPVNAKDRDISRFISDFNIIYGENDEQGKRFVKVDGKRLDITEYIKYRVETEN